MKASIEPNLNIYPIGKATIFDTAHPFIYEPNLSTKIKPEIHFSTTEIGGKEPVLLNVDGAKFDLIEFGFSETFDLMENNSQNGIFNSVIQRVEIADNVRYLGILEVRNTAGDKASIEVPGMRSSNPTVASNGLIVLHDSSAAPSNIIKGIIPTSGAVTLRD
jgi:hypothetical protein